MERINGNNIIGTAVIPLAQAGYYEDETDAQRAAREQREAEKRARDAIKEAQLNPPPEVLAEEARMRNAMWSELSKLAQRNAPQSMVMEARRRWERKIENNWLAYCARVAGKRSEYKTGEE